MIDTYNEFVTDIYNSKLQEIENKIQSVSDKRNTISLERQKLVSKKNFLKWYEKLLKEKKIDSQIKIYDEQIKQLEDEIKNLINEKINIKIPYQKLRMDGGTISRDDLVSAFNVLIKNKIPFSLNEVDIEKIKDIDYKPSYSDTSSFVCVHKTDYKPNAGYLRTTGDATTKKEAIELLGKVYSYEYHEKVRNTVHFALNGEVGDHEAGDWSNCKYAYIIPFDDMPVDKLSGFSTVDTYFTGSLKLPKNAIFICSKEEEDEVRKNNPELQIITYKSKNNVSGFADFMVLATGYNLESCGKWAWSSDRHQQEAIDIAEKNNYPVRAHSYSVEHEKEVAYMIINKLAAVMEIIEQNDLLNSNNLMAIKQDLLRQNIISYDRNFSGSVIHYLCTLGYIDKEEVYERTEEEFSSFVIETMLNNLLKKQEITNERHI